MYFIFCSCWRLSYIVAYILSSVEHGSLEANMNDLSKYNLSEVEHCSLEANMNDLSKYNLSEVEKLHDSLEV